MNLPSFSYIRGFDRRNIHNVQHYRLLPKNFPKFLASNRELRVNNCSNVTNDWVSARFTPTDDHLLCLGGNDGSVGLYNIQSALSEHASNLDTGMLSCLKAHAGAVMGVYGVPGQSKEILSIGGDGTAKLFDMQKGTRIACFDGHETIVRSASFLPGCSNTFATCGRDGKFCLHDSRCQSKKDRHGVPFIPPVATLSEAHLFTERGRPLNGISSSPGLTNIIFLDENTIVTASEKAVSGIRFWDARKLNRKPFLILTIPQKPESKQSGIASMDINRYSNSLFVAVTDNNIYEYLLGCDRKLPERRLKDAFTSSYDITIAASPVSDHLLSGSAETDFALLYTLPSTPSLDMHISENTETLSPDFTLGGHVSMVTSVSWSRSGQYIVTLDESSFRIWQPNFERDELEEFIVKKDNLPSFHRIKNIETSSQNLSMKTFEQLTVSPIKSPFTSPCKKRPKFSPSYNQFIESPGRKKFRIFCKRHLTKNMPLRSNELESQNIKVEVEVESAFVKQSQRNLTDFFMKIQNEQAGEVTSKKKFIEANDTTAACKITTEEVLTKSNERLALGIKRYFCPSPHNRRQK